MKFVKLHKKYTLRKIILSWITFYFQTKISRLQLPWQLPNVLPLSGEYPPGYDKT